MPTSPVRELTGVFHLAKVLPGLRHEMDVLDALDRAVKPFGLRVYAAWQIPINDTAPGAYQVGVNVFLHSSVKPAFWREFWSAYAKNGTSVLARAARLNIGPETWTEATKRLQPKGHERWFRELAGKYGMADGFDCPQGDILIRFHARKILRLGDDERGMINGAAQLAAARLRRLMARKATGKRAGRIKKLSPGELSALTWYSLGEEPAQIAARLGKSVSTINNFLDRARVKLGAKTRAHAVRIAIYGRLLSGLPFLEDVIRLIGGL